MRHFTCVQDLGDLKQALNEAFEIKKDRFQLPCTLVNVQNDRVHTQVHGGLLGA